MAAELAEGLLRGGDGRVRCAWAGHDAAYQAYHDHEWGRPTVDDRWLFEKICLEGFQAGLSWLTILRKREHFREAFANFDARRLARYDDGDIARLLANTGIVRHRGKIVSTINNAARLLDLVQTEGSLAAFAWRHQPTQASRPATLDWATLKAMSTTPESTALSRSLKRLGWTFVGPTTMYAFMQSAGIVNDHIEGCWCRAEVERARRAGASSSCY